MQLCLSVRALPSHVEVENCPIILNIIVSISKIKVGTQPPFQTTRGTTSHFELESVPLIIMSHLFLSSFQNASGYTPVSSS